MTAIYPVLPGLAWSVTKTPRFQVRKQQAVDGRELRLLDQSVPIWTFKLTYDLLRDKHDARASGFGSQGGYDELRTLEGFFLAQQGSFTPFLYDDPTDDSVLAQAIGTGDGSTTAFQLVRSFGSFVEPTLAPNQVTQIYYNGVAQGLGVINNVNSATGVITFNSAPPLGQAITVDFTYYFRCRFSDDSLEFENFMLQLWSAKTVQFESVLN